MRNLFRVSSTIDNWQTRWGLCDGLHMEWFVCDRAAPVIRYEEAIPGYPEAQAHWDYEIGAIDELFTDDEARELRVYLADFPATTVDVTPVELPLPPNVMGIGQVAVGGDSDFYRLSTTEGYPLGVKVWGYYRLDLPTLRWRDRPAGPRSFGWVLSCTDQGPRIDLADDIAALRHFEQTGRFFGN